MGKIKDLTGQRFGKLVAKKIVGKDEFNRTMWYCECDCGGSKVVSTESLRKTKGTRSCGCLHKKDKSETDIAEELGVPITSFQEVKYRLGHKGYLNQEQRNEISKVIKDIKSRCGRVALSDINRYWNYVREAKQ